MSKVRIGLLTRNEHSWCSSKLKEAFEKRGVGVIPFKFSEILARVGFTPRISIGEQGLTVSELDGVLVRPIGRGSLDEIIFRLDLLHILVEEGIMIVNPPECIEKAVDKYYALSILERAGIRVPQTIVTENPDFALAAFHSNGDDGVLKPLFGSRGMGVTRVSDYETARRIFNSLHFVHHVLYSQTYIKHGRSDIRAFVAWGEVVATMRRKSSNSWKTNLSMGAKAIPIKPTKEVEEVALKSAEALGCLVAGVDIIEGKDGLYVNEINSQPGFKGLQTSTKIDIAGKIASSMISNLRR